MEEMIFRLANVAAGFALILYAAEFGTIFILERRRYRLGNFALLFVLLYAGIHLIAEGFLK